MHCYMHVGRKSIAREEVSILKIKKGSTGKNLTGEISAGYAYTHTHTHTRARARARTHAHARFASLLGKDI